ncbi:MAG: 5'/3'-nucleotidase SurE [Alphaproteobacteria bacterium]|nr:5'/3'-nucleotidase SurE [Alphaproteobacteria bacterium]
MTAQDDAPRRVDLAGARVLLTNDDGIEAEGLAVLERAVAPHVGELWVVAPASGRSAASVMTSLRRRIKPEARGARRFAVDGSPADCMLIALQRLMADTPPDLVLSGVNHGANLGDDLNFSGTVGAAVAAALEGAPAIALSVAHGPGGYAAGHDWRQAEARSADLIARLCDAGFAPGGLYAVNYPHDPSDPDAPALVRPAGRQGGSFRLEEDGDGGVIVRHQGDRGVDRSASDYDAVRQGRIAITPVTVDRTDWRVLQRLGEAV